MLNKIMKVYEIENNFSERKKLKVFCTEVKLKTKIFNV